MGRSVAKRHRYHLGVFSAPSGDVVRRGVGGPIGAAAMAIGVAVALSAALAPIETPAAVVVTASVCVVAAAFALAYAAPLTAALVFLIWLPIDNLFFAWATRGVADPAAYTPLLGLKDLYAVAATAGIVASLARSRRLRLTRIDLLFALYAAIVAVYALYWAVSSLIGDDDVGLRQLLEALRPLLLPVYLYVFGRSLPIDGSLRLAAVLVAATLAASVVGFVEYFFVPVDWWFSDLNLFQFITEVQGEARTGPDAASNSLEATYSGETLKRLHGPYVHPNGFAYAAVIPSLLVLTALVDRRVARGSRRLRRLFMIGAIPILGATALTLGRGAVIAIAIGFALILALRAGSTSWARVILAALVFALAAGPFVTAIVSAARFDDPSTVAHVEALRDGASIALENPLGLGAGANVWTENLYLAIATRVGLLAAVTMGVILVSLAVIALRAGARGTQVDDLLLLSLGGASAGLAVASLSAEPLLTFGGAAAFWVVAGFATSLTHARRHVGDQSSAGVA